MHTNYKMNKVFDLENTLRSMNRNEERKGDDPTNANYRLK